MTHSGKKRRWWSKTQILSVKRILASIRIKWRKSKRLCMLKITTLIKTHLIEVSYNILSTIWTFSNLRKLSPMLYSYSCLRKMSLGIKTTLRINSLIELSSYCPTNVCIKRQNTISQMWLKLWMIKFSTTRCTKSLRNDRFTVIIIEFILRNSYLMRNVILQILGISFTELLLVTIRSLSSQI